MTISRRTFNAAAIAVVACLAALGPTVAAADDLDATELAKPVPLGDVVLGSATAPVTMIEYASFSCGHCAAFNATTYPALKAEYIDTGKVRFIFREYPLDLPAAAASLIARCAGKGDATKYHEAASRLFAEQDAWIRNDTREQLRRIATRSGLDDQGFETCMSDQGMVDRLKAGMEQASARFKVDSTPTFFINGTPVRGAYPIDEFRRVIEAKLKG